MENNKIIKAVFKCLEEYKLKFNHSHCLVTISVGQEVHENEKFLTTIHLINNAFKKCTICVDDSLQRYSMGLYYGSNTEDFYQQSIIEGTKWLERNSRTLRCLKIPHDIIHWDKWLMHKHFLTTRQKIVECYSNNADYKKSIDHSIEEFLTRFQRRLEYSQSFDYEHGFNICREYLFEECAALCLWKDEGYDFEVYPSKRNSAMAETHKRFIAPTHPNLLNHVTIKFKNRKQFRQQHFNVSEQTLPEQEVLTG